MKALMQIRETSWNALMALDDEALEAESADAAELRRLGQIETGFWNGTINFTAVSVIGEPSQLDSFYNYFPPADRLGYWKWGDDGKVDFATEYTGQHDDLLFLHEDHVEYDSSGNPTGTRPAAFDDTNWANDWAGTGRNRFARAYSRGFSGGWG